MTAELHLLGGASISGADEQLVSGAAAQPRRIAVLAVLADAWPAPVTRDRLVGLIWPDQDDQGAKRLLTQALYALRRELGDFTRGSGRDVALDADALRVDLIEFRRALADGDVHRAAALYRGPLLDGVHVRGAVEFERWAESLRDSTRRQFQGAVEQIVVGLGKTGNWREAAHWTERLVREAPYDAGAVLRLIDCWLQAGDMGAALAAATAYEKRMREELELDPDPAVRRHMRDAVSMVRRDGDVAPVHEIPTPPPASRSDAAAAASQLLEGGVGAAMPSPPPAPRAAPWMRGRRAAWIAAAASIALVAAVVFFARRAAPPAGRVVNVLALDAHGDSALAGLGADVASMLVANLDGSAGVQLRAAGDSGAKGAPWATLRGEVVAAGGQIRLDAVLVSSADGAPLGTASVTGTRDSLITLADRLSLKLVTAFYPAEVRGRINMRSLNAFRQTAVLRRHLDGEAAIRRGAFVEAHEHFAAVTALDSALALSWYRRAVAAELAHRGDDAAASLAQAEARQAMLSERGRLRLQAFRLWGNGDARAAESVYRRLVTGDSQDREAWFHLAEVDFHAGPLHGQPLDRARDSWDRVVALDSGDLSALMHAIRLHARAGHVTSTRALLRRAELAGASGAPLAESQIIAAMGVRDRGDGRDVARMLDSVPEYSLQFLQAVVAGQLEQPAAAIPIARRMVTADRPASMQAQGYIALAHLALATGRWREAMQALDSAAPRNPVAAAWTRAYFLSMPFVRASADDVTRAEQALAAVSELRAPAPLYLQIGVALPAASVIRPYLTELLQRGSRDAEGSTTGEVDLAIGALRCPRGAAEPGVVALCADLELSLLAESAIRRGRFDEALARLDAMELQVPYQYAARSQFYARSRERFMLAALLERQGRDAEAEEHYESLPHGAWADYVFLAPAYLGRARIRERRGDRDGAASLYKRVLTLWDDPDPELAAVHREARAGLARVTAAP